ncbi:hypothetical protein HU200_066516 [Digitaria exilis]|uniref:Uncharacterized protein n=1 Tax=Digitaria exilis TaxID=1010633 RepID=A0A834ZY28_9POAL|nr:hypothetical protein HU200_066516 [Digitaria exilis]
MEGCIQGANPRKEASKFERSRRSVGCVRGQSKNLDQGTPRGGAPSPRLLSNKVESPYPIERGMDVRSNHPLPAHPGIRRSTPIVGNTDRLALNTSKGGHEERKRLENSLEPRQTRQGSRISGLGGYTRGCASAPPRTPRTREGTKATKASTNISPAGLNLTPMEARGLLPAKAHHDNFTTASVALEGGETLERGSTLDVDDHPRAGTPATIEAQQRSSLPYREQRPGLCDPSTPVMMTLLCKRRDSLRHATAHAADKTPAKSTRHSVILCQLLLDFARLGYAITLEGNPRRRSSKSNPRSIDSTITMPSAGCATWTTRQRLRHSRPIALLNALTNGLGSSSPSPALLVIHYYEQHEPGAPHRCWDVRPRGRNQDKNSRLPSGQRALAPLRLQLLTLLHPSQWPHADDTGRPIPARPSCARLAAAAAVHPPTPHVPLVDDWTDGGEASRPHPARSAPIRSPHLTRRPPGPATTRASLVRADPYKIPRLESGAAFTPLILLQATPRYFLIAFTVSAPSAKASRRFGAGPGAPSRSGRGARDARPAAGRTAPFPVRDRPRKAIGVDFIINEKLSIHRIPSRIKHSFVTEVWPLTTKNHAATATRGRQLFAPPQRPTNASLRDGDAPAGRGRKEERDGERATKRVASGFTARGVRPIGAQGGRFTSRPVGWLRPQRFPFFPFTFGRPAARLLLLRACALVFPHPFSSPHLTRPCGGGVVGPNTEIRLPTTLVRPTPPQVMGFQVAAVAPSPCARALLLLALDLILATDARVPRRRRMRGAREIPVAANWGAGAMASGRARRGRASLVGWGRARDAEFLKKIEELAAAAGVQPAGCGASSVGVPLSLRMLKRKKQQQQQVARAGGGSRRRGGRGASVGRAFSSMVLIVRELQSFALRQMRDALLCDDGPGARPGGDARLLRLALPATSSPARPRSWSPSCSSSPTSPSTPWATASPPRLPPSRSAPPTAVAAVIDTTHRAEPRFDAASVKTFSVGRTASVGGTAAVAARPPPVAGCHRRRPVRRQPSTPAGRAAPDAVDADEQAILGDDWSTEASRHAGQRFARGALSDPDVLLKTEDHAEHVRTQQRYDAGRRRMTRGNSLILANCAHSSTLVQNEHDRVASDARALRPYATFPVKARDDLAARRRLPVSHRGRAPGNAHHAAAYSNFL